VFIAVAWARAEPQRAYRVLGWSALVAAVVLVTVSAVCGLGPEWVSGSLSTPAKVRLAITPSTAVGYSFAHAFGLAASAKAIESAVGAIALGLTGLFGAWLLWRVRLERLAWSLGLLLLASVLGGPAAWPWYAIWGLALLACAPAVARWRWLPVVIALSAFLIRADGQLVLPRETAPLMLGVYALAALALFWRRRSWGGAVTGAPEFAR
jgi:hypothetical protein